jgi:hypothetical protein
VLVNLEITRIVESDNTDEAGLSTFEHIVEVSPREFRLDFLNFPKVDNTRLFDNHRFAIVMENFNSGNDPHILITGVIFPAEYASLRDKPGMREVLDHLNSSLETELE